jgi:hypothetical protein
MRKPMRSEESNLRKKKIRLNYKTNKNKPNSETINSGIRLRSMTSMICCKTMSDLLKSALMGKVNPSSVTFLCLFVFINIIQLIVPINKYYNSCSGVLGFWGFGLLVRIVIL